MAPIVHALLAFVVSLFRSRVSVHLEIPALQHQLAVYQRSIRGPQVRLTDRLFWAWLSPRWSRWRDVLVFVQPPTALAWQRQRFEPREFSWSPGAVRVFVAAAFRRGRGGSHR